MGIRNPPLDQQTARHSNTAAQLTFTTKVAEDDQQLIQVPMISIAVTPPILKIIVAHIIKIKHQSRLEPKSGPVK
jgi:hypothetical protein